MVMKKIEYSVVSSKELNRPIRVLLVDDQNFIRRFITQAISGDRISIVGTAENGRDAIKQVELLHPDVALIDIEMPEMDGITATEIITQKFDFCKVLVLSSHQTGDYLQKALRVGAKGYLTKDSPATELTNAIYSVYKGYTQLSPGLLEKVLTPEVEIVPQNLLDEPTEITESKTESDWAESTRENINTLPRVSLRAILYAFLILLAGVIPWMMFAKVDEIGTAIGKLEPKGRVVELDSPANGTVVEIAVEEGETVKAQQPIMELDSELIDSELEQQRQKIIGQQNQLNQLKLLQNQQSLSLRTQEQQNQAQQFEKKALIDQARQNVTSLKAAYEAQLAEKEAQLKQAEEAIKASESAHQTAKIRAAAALEKVPRYRSAYEQGALSKDLLSEAQQQAQEYQENITQTASEIAQAQAAYTEQQNGYEKLRQQTTAEIEQAQLRLAEQQRGLDSLSKSNSLAVLKSQEESKNTEAQIATLEGEIAQTKSSIEGAEYQMQQRVLYAPIEGTVFQLPIKKPGAVVQMGQMVAQIAPEDSQLILRGKMRSKESGFLEVGLPVNIKFDAYPFQDYGVIPGRLTWISPDSRVTQTPNGAESLPVDSQSSDFFEVEIELERNYIETPERTVTLTPGQTATAEIVIRQRRLADIILEPFKSLQKGGIQL